MSSFGVVFDMDGVIVDTNPYHKISLKQFCEKYGYHFTDEELIKRIYGRTNNEWITNLFGKLPKERLLELGEEKEAMFRAIYKDAVEPVAGLENFLKKLTHQKIPNAIGTSAPRSNVDFILDNTGLRNYFPVILDQSHVEHGKPNPEIYLKTAQALNLPPAQTIVFEDSLSGIEAAQRAGARVVGVTTTHTPAELKHCDLVIPDFINLELESLSAIIKD
ncbi:MAG TPA: HAD family phosphatase [Cytophagales bacterium]|nr:HAD family phosphatase [Cytophagales bacterium]HRG07355.1 HAD family phosphatase [Cyclobacteriaceae bacterium]